MGIKVTQLQNIIIPEKIVATSDTEGFTVRGLSPLDILGLYRRHTGQLTALFEELLGKYSESNTMAVADVQAVAVRLINDAPHLMAEIIALASGADPLDEVVWDSVVDKARLLTFPVQADAFDKIGSLTFTSEMPPKKFAALVAGAIQAAMANLPNPLPVPQI